MRMISRFALLSAFAAILTACGGGGTQTRSGAAGGLVPNASQGVVNDVPADGKHILYPPLGLQHIEAHRGGQTNNLIYGGGTVMNAPKVYVVFWGWTSDPSGEAAYLQNFLSGVGGSTWLQTVTQYYSITAGQLDGIENTAGQLGGYEYDTTALPSRLSDAAIAAEAARAATHFGISGNNVMVVVATPHGRSTRGFGTSWCAYHSYTSAGGGNLAYTNLPYQTDAGAACGENFINSGTAGVLDGVSIVGGHEYAESITDPYPSSGWLDKNGNEIADKCAWSSSSGDATLTTGTFAVQPLWSNASGSCVMSY